MLLLLFILFIFFYINYISFKVAHGQLRCIGTNIHLKNKFGSGYQLTLVFPPANASQVKQNISTFVKQHLPKWEELFSKANTTPQSLYITIPYDQEGEVPDLLQTLEDNARELGVEEITMNLSSLEEISLILLYIFYY